jgi:hypothetical protein
LKIVQEIIEVENLMRSVGTMEEEPIITRWVVEKSLPLGQWCHFL